MVDEEGVTKLHYWRESSYLRASVDNFTLFLYKQFEGLFKDKQIIDIVESVQQSINQDFDESKPRNDTDLERLQVTAGILNHDDDAVDNNDEYVVNLTAFLCEMF